MNQNSANPEDDYRHMSEDKLDRSMRQESSKIDYLQKYSQESQPFNQSNNYNSNVQNQSSYMMSEVVLASNQQPLNDETNFASSVSHNSWNHRQTNQQGLKNKEALKKKLFKEQPNMKNLQQIDLDRKLMIMSGQQTMEDELIQNELRAWQARLDQINKVTDEVSIERQQSIGSEKSMFSKQMFEYMRDKNLIDMEYYLKNVDPVLILHLPQLYDKTDSGKNLMHKCAQIKSDIILETLVEKYRRTYVQVMMENQQQTTIGFNTQKDQMQKQFEREAKANIKDWVNQITQDENGFFAIHFACFCGQSGVIRLLYKYGAELHVRNKMGLTPVHVAAQADKAFPLQFLYSRGMDMESTDNEGQTPLHWACYQGAEEAIYYLLAWIQKINLQDNNGKTALHQAVEQAQRFSSYRAFKEMLIKGSSRDLQDNKERTPLEVIPYGMVNPTNQEELKRILDKQPISLPCSQFKTPLKKLNRNYNTMMYYLVMMFGTFLQMQLFVYPFVSSNWVLLFNILFVVINYCYCRAAFDNPGYIKSVPNLQFEKLVEKMDPNALCPNCETAYTTTSRHCYICDKCIGKFDHHCQWINNCVGRRNHRIFYAYILTLLIYFIFLIIFTISTLVSEVEFKTDIKIFQFESESTDIFLFNITLIEVLIISCMFGLPLSYLVVIQTRNVLMNTTTYARFSKQAQKQAEMVGQAEGDQGTEDWPHSAVFIESLLLEQKEENAQFKEYNSLDQVNEGGQKEIIEGVLRPKDPSDYFFVL